jgi:GLPGLI family protein
MKKIIFAFLLISLTYLSNAQETAKVAFLYSYKHQIDTSRKDYYYTEKMVLLQGEKTSIYKSYDAYISDSTIKAQISQSENEINITGLKISTKPLIRDMVLKYFEKNKSIQIRYLLNYYYWEEGLHKINWQILPDTMTLKGLICQKATCEFKGRIYAAWFSTEIISNNGPWKFGGLPGLILKVSDSKNEIIFEFEGYTYLSNSTIELPEKSISSSAKEYNKVRDAYLNDPMSFLQNAGGIGGNVKLSNMSIPLKGRKPINNPIELKEEN